MNIISLWGGSRKFNFLYREVSNMHFLYMVSKMPFFVKRGLEDAILLYRGSRKCSFLYRGLSKIPFCCIGVSKMPLFCIKWSRKCHFCPFLYRGGGQILAILYTWGGPENPQNSMPTSLSQKILKGCTLVTSREGCFLLNPSQNSVQPP